MLLYSPRWLFLYPGALLMLMALTVLLWLLPGPRTVGRLTLDVHTMLYAAAAVLLGFQAIAFAVFSKFFAITEGLLPEDARLNKLFPFVTLEVGLAIGAALAIGGLAASAYAVNGWILRGFAPLDYPVTMRIVIPAATAMTLGFQIVLSSFFMSVLGLGRRSNPGLTHAVPLETAARAARF
jgi:hypothetical protein